MSKFWKLNSAKRTQPYTSISEPNNLQTVPVNRTSNKCTLLSRFLCCINDVRTALNEAVPPRNQCQINVGCTTKNCAENLMQPYTFLLLPELNADRTTQKIVPADKCTVLSRFVCQQINAGRIVINTGRTPSKFVPNTSCSIP